MTAVPFTPLTVAAALPLAAAQAAPVVPIRIIGVVVALAGVAFLGIAHLSRLGRLHRNRWVGIRTPETLASEAAWAAGQAAAVSARRWAGLGAVVLGLGMVWLAEDGTWVNLAWIGWLVVWTLVARQRAVRAAAEA